MIRPPPRSPLFPYTTLFRSARLLVSLAVRGKRKAPRPLRFRPIPQPRSHPPPSGEPAACRAEKNRSEEHTSELQSHSDLVCRLLLEKKKTTARPTALALSTR